MKILRMADLDLAGKRVFVRSDLNVPLDERGAIADDTRVRASLAAYRMALDKGAALMARWFHMAPIVNGCGPP